MSPVAAAELERFARDVFARCGLSDDDAAAAAETLCYADRHGFSTHGVLNLERIYVPRLRSGQIDPSARIERISDAPATAVLDAHDGLGLVVGTRAIDLAIEKARGVGAAAVAVRRSSHFGSAGHYAARAADAGMVGLAMTNLGTQAVVPPPGGSRPALGTNPIAASAPAGTLPRFALDMSTSAVSTGQVRAAERAGEPVPEGWLIDLDGRPTTDPGALDRGEAHLQWLGGAPETGGYKGFGLGLLVELLCGVLAGAGVGPRPPADGPEADGSVDRDVGHFFLCIDVARFRPLPEFAAAMDGVLAALLDSPAGAGARGSSYPGHPEADAAKRAESGGVELREDVAQSVRRVAADVGATLPAALAPVAGGAQGGSG